MANFINCDFGEFLKTSILQFSQFYIENNLYLKTIVLIKRDHEYNPLRTMLDSVDT